MKPDFIAGPTGAVVKYDPKADAVKPVRPLKALTRHQRATMYFTALRHIRKMLGEVGFKELAQDGHGLFTVEMPGFILEVKVEESGSRPIALVTSFPGYVYDPEKITADVRYELPAAPGEYVIRLIGSFSSTLRGQADRALCDWKSDRPIYVVIPKDSTDPLRDAFMNTLKAIHSMASQHPGVLEKIQAAMASRNTSADFERLNAADPLLFDKND